MHIFKEYVKAFCTLCTSLIVSAAGGHQLKKLASGKGGAILLADRYLYAVLNTELCTYDVSNPVKPVLVSKTQAAGNRQMVRSGSNLYLSCRSRGVQIFSIEDPARPREISRFYPSELATGLSVCGNVLAVTLRIYGVEFFDVSDPAKVRCLGLLRTGEAQSAAFFGKGMIAVGDWGSAARVVIADVRDPSKPSVISTAELDGYGDGTGVSGKYLYAATGMNRSRKHKNYRGYGHGLEIFDISDVKNPRKTGMVKFAVNAKTFPDWWQVIVSGNTAFVSDTSNGVYVVDVTDKSRPAILSHIKLPLDSSSQIAVGKGVVYISGHNRGLYLYKHPKAEIPRPPEAEITLPAKSPAPEKVPDLHNAAVPGFVWSIARWDSFLYAACGGEGVREFKITSDGSLQQLRTFPGVAMDCAVSGKLLFTAADHRLKVIDRSTGKVLSTVEARNGIPFLQLRLFGSRLCTNGRTETLQIWDVSDPTSPRFMRSFSGGGLLYGDMLPERSAKGKFTVNWHSRHPRWYDAESSKEIGAFPKLHRCSHQQNGITEIGGKCLLLGRREAFLFSPETPEKYTVVPMHPVRSGIPTSKGRMIAVSDRRNGAVHFYDYDGKKLSEIPELRISLPFTLTGRVVFHKGKVYIPAGRCGIYFR